MSQPDPSPNPRVPSETRSPAMLGRDARGPALSAVQGFAEITLETNDLDALERFYREVFALEVLSRDDDRIWLAAGERCRLGLWSPGKKEFGDQGGRHVHFAFSASPGQLNMIARRLDDRGIETTGPIEHDGGDRSLYFEDLAGNLVEVWDFFTSGDGAQHGVDALR